MTQFLSSNFSKQKLLSHGYTIASAARALGVSRYRISGFLDGKIEDASIAMGIMNLPQRTLVFNERARMNNIDMVSLLGTIRLIQLAVADLLEEFELRLYPHVDGTQTANLFISLTYTTELLLGQVDTLTGMLKDMTPDNQEALHLIDGIHQTIEECEADMKAFVEQVMQSTSPN